MAFESHSGKYFQLKVILFLVLLIFGWLLFEYASLVYRSYSIDIKKQWFEDEKARLVGENQELAREYQYFQTDYFLVREAKRKLNKKEAGEDVMVISDPREATKKPGEWWQGIENPQVWWDYFFEERTYDTGS